ncbi:MAG: hypothetical protein ACYC09_14730 [Bacteroidota bacterium]
MSILSSIKNLFTEKEKTKEVSFEAYANLPIYQMLNDEPPFDKWKKPGRIVANDLVGRFRICVWMYQFYIFYILTGQKFGHDAAEKLISIQTERLNKLSNEIGKQLESAFRQIHENISSQVDNPIHIKNKEEHIQLPFEYYLAIELLTVGEDALFPITESQLKSGDIPDMNGLDLVLAECLEYGKNSAQIYFQSLLQNLKVVI